MTAPRPFDRTDSHSARLVAKTLFPDPKIRRAALAILKGALQTAHEIDEQSWGVTLRRDKVQLNVGRGEALSLSSGGIEFLSLKNVADSKAKTEAGKRRSLPGSLRVRLEGEQLEKEWPQWQPLVESTIQRAASEFEGQNFKNPLWRSAHSSGVIEYLGEEFEGEIPTPAYFKPLAQIESLNGTSPATLRESRAEENNAFDLKATLFGGIARAGLHLPDLHLAAFFTALQTKGFVVLSGLSGTGKTRLASEFAAMLPLAGANSHRIVRASEIQSATGRFPLPKAVAEEITRLTSPPRAGEKRAIGLECDGHAHSATLVREGETLVVRARSAARKALEQQFGNRGALEVDVELEESRLSLRFVPLAPRETFSNCLVLPVRADWRDSGALLGFWNPLANRYEWTPFLRFILRARENYLSGSGVAHFVVLDEMNLARVEHFGADLLSVLESGRDERGMTRQPLRLQFDQRAVGELPPSEVFLPPNLYFVGTLNEDETTFALSPKVLDRVWMLDSPPVDFSSFGRDLGAKEITSLLTASDRAGLDRSFSRRGQFVGLSRALVSEELEADERWRSWLSELNVLLENHERGFGFRAFEEIVGFVALSRENELFASPLQAFDCALSLKIAPRLRGLGTALEAVLNELQVWAQSKGLALFEAALTRRLRRLEREGYL